MHQLFILVGDFSLEVRMFCVQTNISHARIFAFFYNKLIKFQYWLVYRTEKQQVRTYWN